MRRRLLVSVDVAPARTRELVERALGLVPVSTTELEGPLPSSADETARLRATLTPDPDSSTTHVALEASSDLRVPYFEWLVRAVTWWAAGSVLRHAAASLVAARAGDPPPRPPRRIPFLPPAPFSVDHARRLAAVALVGALANFSGSLLTQNGDAVTDSFGRSDEALGFALALSRVGVLFALVASALADRVGRRRLLLVSLATAAVANGIAAAAPTFEVFTASQVVARAAIQCTAVIAAVAAVEDAPEAARAYALSMFALALGLGFATSVLLLPLADLGNDGWRIAFALSAFTVLALPSLGRTLHETTRYRRLSERTRERGRVTEVFDRRYGGRFLLLGATAFLTNVFAAPSSQLTNRYLTGAHDFSNSQVALFRGVTTGLPGFLGILVAGRLAESRGRRPVAVFGLLIASMFQVLFFLGDGVALWLAPSIAIVAAACAGVAVGTVSTELFPTEVRGTSNGFLLVCGVAGAALGLLLATQLKSVVGGLGIGIAVCGVAPIVAAVLLLPRLPETRARRLDEVSPSEI
ncbi:MAG TPA: MFS transporter [Acidimicrobiia bacterium]